MRDKAGFQSLEELMTEFKGIYKSDQATVETDVILMMEKMKKGVIAMKEHGIEYPQSS